jgi:threonine/homoserine/homoserine lactone efflux protein
LHVHLDVLAGFVAFGVVAAGPNNLMLMTSGVKFGFGRPHLAGVVLGFWWRWSASTLTRSLRSRP